MSEHTRSAGSEGCREPWSDLDDYLDGEVSPGRRREVEAHLETCGVCREEVEALKVLARAVRGLADEVPPRRDLWPEVVPRLQPRTAQLPPRRASWQVVMQVAAALGFLVLGAGLQRLVDSAPVPPVERIVEHPVEQRGDSSGEDRGHEIALASSGGDAEFLLAEAEVLRAKETLRLAIERRRSDLSPSTLKVVERNLLIIDEALADLRAALEEDPENPRLQKLLLAHHQQQVELMRRLAS